MMRFQASSAAGTQRRREKRARWRENGGSFNQD